jgi:hypothetical protein
MLPEGAADHHSELGRGRFLHCPVDRDVTPHRFDECAAMMRRLSSPSTLGDAVVNSRTA